MKAVPLSLSGVYLIEPKVFDDKRGLFFESFNQKQFEEAIGKAVSLAQDNHSRGVKNVLRGLHYQIQRPPGKLVRVVQGEVFDVVVDLRESSPTFGQWIGEVLSAANRRQLWIPEGFAHGFVVLSDSAEFLYKTTDYYAPEYECCLLWNDATLGIVWPVGVQPILSAKDAKGLSFHENEVFP